MHRTIPSQECELLTRWMRYELTCTPLGRHSQVVALQERLKAADGDADMYNRREALLGLPLTDYSQAGASVRGREGR
jgi:hypothetical protein